jgi:hypothetical protein
MNPASSAHSLDPSSLTNVLNGVSAVSASDAWAVGYYVNTSGTGNTVDNTLILHWNGTAWSRVSSPNPGNNNYLWSVSAVSRSVAWAVGCTFANGVGHTLILRWTGTAWSQVTSPSPKSGGPCLEGVSAVSGSVAWAAGTETANAAGPGYTLLLRWNGAGWSQATSPRLNLGRNLDFAVSAASASDAWAVRDYVNSATDATDTFILHWNGTAWSRVTSPNPSSTANHLYGVSAVSATDAWATGDYVNSASKATDTLTLHWNGTAWSKVSSPSPSSTLSLLGGVSAVSASDAWAAGAYYNSATKATDTLTLHWSGTAWSKVNSPSPGGTANGLRGVSTVSATDAWTVGWYHDNATDTTHTLILHWNGTAWSVA